MKKTHFYQLLLGLSLVGLLFFTACGGNSSQDEAAIKAEVEALEAASEDMTKIKEEIESSKVEVEEAMEDLDELLDDNN